MQKSVPNLKTLFITYGGANYKLFKFLDENFQNNSIMSRKFRNDFKKNFEHLKGSRIEFTMSKIDTFFKAIEKVKAADIIIANCPISGAIAYLTTIFNKKKRVFIMCQDFYEYFDVSLKPGIKKSMLGFLLKKMIRMSCRGSLVIALSSHIKNRAIVYGAKNVKIIPIYGVDLNVFKPKKRGISFKTTKRIVLTTARPAPEKGLIYLLEAISKIDNVLLVMAGPGNSREKLDAIACQYNLKDKVKVVGEIDPIEIADYYNACDVFVLPSLKEGLGFSSAEAMACKKPVVASNTGGIPDIVLNNKTGLLVTPGKSDEIQDAILRILKSKTLGRRLAKAGYEHVKKNYEEGYVVRKFVNAIKSKNY